MAAMVVIRRTRLRASRALLVAVVCICGAHLLAQSSPSAAAVEHYSEEGQRALAQGNYVDAEHAFEKLRQLEPGIAEVHANLGLIYFQEGKFERAVPALQQALKLKPTLTKSASLLAMSLSELGRYSEALPGLEKGFHHSLDPEIKRMCGLQLERAYTEVKLDSKAVEVAIELNRLYPEDPEILYHNGKIFGNFAFLNIQKLAQVAPASVWRHLAVAEASESQGAYDTAIGEYRQILGLNSHRPGIHYRLGRTLLARSRQTTSAEDTAAALKEFELELQLDPSNANAAYEIGESYRNSGQLEEAQKFFEQALKYYPEFEEAHLGLAAVLMSLDRSGLALPHLQKAIELNSGNEVSWYRLSQVQGRLGNASEQQRAFAQFQQLRNQKSSQQEAGKQLFSPSEVTKQELGPVAAQQK